MKQKILALYDAVWLPALLLIATSWLYAPWLNGARLGSLQVISVYEGSQAPYSWLFRICDVVGALIIIAAIVRTRLLHRQRWLALTVLMFMVLVVVDVVFVIGCYQHCSVWAVLSHKIHDIESVVSLLLLAVATAIDAYVGKRWMSRIFLLLQIAAGSLIVASVFDQQTLVFVQYVYQTATIAWLAYVLRRFFPAATNSQTMYRVRRVLGSILFVLGLLEIVAAFHLRVRGYLSGPLAHHMYQQLPVWLASHSIIAGATVLYLSRQVFRGQRRAAIMVAVVLMTLAIKYALITPRPAALAVTEVVLVLLWYNWHSFNRNLGAPPIVSRLKNLLILFVGVAVAVILLFAVAVATGRQAPLIRNVTHIFDTSQASFRAKRDGDTAASRGIRRFQTVSASLAVVLIAFTLWSVFRPARELAEAELLEPDEVMRLLQAYASSSEDYFKLWPADKTYFKYPGIDGCIAYKKVGNTAFALADPICTPANRQRLLDAFVHACRSRGWSACFFLVSSASREVYTNAGLKTFQIGSSAVVRQAEFSEHTVKDKWWRWQLNRSVKSGVSYSISQPPHSPALLAETAQVSAHWLERSGQSERSEQGFALGYYDEEYLGQCVLYTLRDNAGRLIAFTNQLPTYNGILQVTVDLIRFEPDAQGAMPVLIAHVIKTLHESSTSNTFDLGFVPLAKLDTRLAAIARRMVAGRYSAAGLEQFKGKFKPDWQSQYLAYDGDLVDLTTLIARLETAMKS